MTDQTLEQRFVEAWGEVKNPELDGENPHFKNKYATLKSTLGVIREACKPHGIAYMQKLVKTEDGCREFHSFLLSEDGEDLDLSVFPVEQPPNPQAFGSNLTYAKRQQAQADWGITGEEDDDGNAAADAAKDRKPTQKAKAPSRGKTDDPAPPEGPQAKEVDRIKDHWHKIKELKAEAIVLGIKESAITGWIAATFKDENGDMKDMKSFNLTEVVVVEGYLSTLIEDKKKLNAEKEKNDVDQPSGD